jgi:hypothetical protein
MLKRLLTLAIAVSLAATTYAQEPTPAKPPAPKASEPAKADPAVDAWLKTLGGKIADQNEVVRASAHQGIISVGRPALPFLKTLADGGDQAIAAEAKKVMERIERGRGPGGLMAEMSERMKSELGLNAEQSKKFDEITEASGKKRADLNSQMEDGNLTREEMRAAMGEIMAETEKAMKSLLSEEQFKKYQETIRSRMGGGRQGGGEGGQGGGEGGGRRRRGGGGG